MALRAGLVFLSMPKVTEYFESDRKKHWLEKIGESEWGGGKFLYELLRDNRLKELCGEKTKVLLLTEADDLLSFCTYAEQDDIRDISLTPWVGFVFTFPKHRGKRCFGLLMNHVRSLAQADGHRYVYISTNAEGLYEKYGCTYWKNMTDFRGEVSRVYRLEV